VGEQPPWNPYGQHDPNQWQGQPYQGRPPYPPQQSYRQEQPHQGQPPYQGQPYEPPYPQGQLYSHQPWPPSGHRGWPARKSWLRRHKVLSVLGGLVALIVIGGIASSIDGGNPASQSASADGQATLATQIERQIDPRLATVYGPDAHLECAPVGTTGQFSCVAVNSANVEMAAWTVTVPTGWKPGEPLQASLAS
jgi:hypothetical protein